MFDIILMALCGVISATIYLYRIYRLEVIECRRAKILSRTIGFIAKDNNYNLRR